MFLQQSGMLKTPWWYVWYTFQFLWNVFCGVSQSQHQLPFETSGVQQHAIGFFSNSHSCTALSWAEHCAVSPKSGRIEKSFGGLRRLIRGSSGFWRLGSEVLRMWRHQRKSFQKLQLSQRPSLDPNTMWNQINSPQFGGLTNLTPHSKHSKPGYSNWCALLPSAALQLRRACQLSRFL